MKTTLLSSIVLALYALGALGAPVEERSPATNVVRSADVNFVSTCTDISFNASNDELTAVCRTFSGAQVTSSISLNNCIVNNGGGLFVQANGGSSGSCTDITFQTSASTAILSAQCKNRSKGTDATSIDLNNVLTNNNGILTCP